MPSTPPLGKRSLRRGAREQSAVLEWSAISPIVAVRIASLPEFAAARHVLLYLATDHEISVEALARRFPTKSWYAPRCIENGGLVVHTFHWGETPLIRGLFGLREPDAMQPPVAPEILDIVFVPGLLFTPTGDRLGHGGGYYDRFLPRLSPACCRVGVACEATMVEALPREPWDAPVDVVVTEGQIFRPLLRAPFSKVEPPVDKDPEKP